MLRLAKSLGCVVLVSAWLMLATAPAGAQAPASPAMRTPQATMPQAPAPANTAPAASAPSPNVHARHKKAAPVAEAPATPPPPPTLEQTAPTPPRVSYQNGQLTIDATNSTLAQVLRAVQSRTGASIDIPGGAASERVVGQLGPGLPRDVLNTLLNGSKFDYVILGVTGNPGAVEKVILTPRQGGATITAQGNTTRPAVQDDESQEESAPVADTAENDFQNPDQAPPPPPPGGFRHPMMPPGGQVNPGAGFGNGDQNGAKTPEQLMQQMQEQQQQQQQYQQQLNPANQNPQPQ